MMSGPLAIQAHAVFYRALLFSLATHLASLAWDPPPIRIEEPPLSPLDARLEPQPQPVSQPARHQPVAHQPVAHQPVVPQPVARLSPVDLSVAAPVPLPVPVSVSALSSLPPVTPAPLPALHAPAPAPSPALAVAPSPPWVMTAAQHPVAEVPHIVPDTQWYPARKLDAVPRRLGMAQPRYPESAQRREVTGNLKVRLQVNALGEVESVEIVSARPEGVFDATVLAFFKAARYQPPQRDGRPVRAIIEERVSFALND